MRLNVLHPLFAPAQPSPTIWLAVFIGLLFVIVGFILLRGPLRPPNWRVIGTLAVILIGELLIIVGLVLLLAALVTLLPASWFVLAVLIGGLVAIASLVLMMTRLMALLPTLLFTRIGGVLAIVGGLLATLAYLCLPFYTRGTVTLTAGQIALLLTRIAGIAAYSSPRYGYGCGYGCADGYTTVSAMAQSWQAWWWLWWVVPAVGVLAAALGAALLTGDLASDKVRRRLVAAGVIEAGIVGLIVLVYLGLLVYLPGLLSAATVCVLCDIGQTFRALLQTAQLGFWVTAIALLIVVAGGVLARLATERPATVSSTARLNSTPAYFNLNTNQVSAHTRVAHIRVQPSPAGPPQYDFVPVGGAQFASLSGREYDQITRAELERLPYGMPSVPVERGVTFAVRLPNRRYAKVRVKTDPPNPTIEWITYMP